MKACEDAGFNPGEGKMVILGAGGAAKSILVQAALDGLSDITVFNRRGTNWDMIEGIIEVLRKETSCNINLLEYNNDILRKELSEARLLTNASSVGMAPYEEGCLIEDISLFHKDLAVYDIIYNPLETRLMKLAKQAGCRTANGKLMLLYQGAAAFKIWTGKDMPVEKIKRALFS